MSFTNCPICSGSSTQLYLKVKDFTVTGKVFQIVSCNDCTFKYTIDAPSESEIGPYYKSEEYISHTDTKSGLISRIYHLIRKFTLKQKRSWISRYYPSKGSLLDYGCGTGAFLFEMYSNEWNVKGYEPDESARNLVKQNYGLNILTKTELQEIQPESFDIITLWHVLEHVHTLKHTLTHLVSLLNPNGFLLIAVPNSDSFDAEYYKEYWAAYDVPRHLYHFTPTILNVLAKEVKCELVDLIPMRFDPFYIALLSEKYKKSGIFGYIRAFFVGIGSNLNPVKKASSVVYVLKRTNN